MVPQPAQTDRETFLAHVRESGLIAPERLEKAIRKIPQTDRGRIVARTFVEQGLLTRFQAERLLAGRTDGYFLGQYRILDQLGRGGMGKVFKAEHITMSRVVALKVLSPHLTQTEKARQLFKREVKAAAKLNHPNIVTAFDANELNDRWFLVMEFVDGPNLHQLVKEHGPLPISQACDFIRQTAKGLQFAHDLGMVHRDIKPANLLAQKNSGKATSQEHTLKILDFGLARLNFPGEGDEPHPDSIETTKQTVMGTPDYMAPEQARSVHAVDGRSDLYSLGCTFYFLLTGQVPFPGGTVLEKLVRHSSEMPIPVEQLRPDCPPEVAAILLKLLSKKPEDRFDSGNHLAEALSPFSEEETNIWITVEPLPIDNDLAPTSGSQLQQSRPASDHRTNDPWAGIDEASEPAGTLSGQDAMTSMSNTGNGTARSSRYSRAGSRGLGVWLYLMPAIGLLVVGIVIVAIRQILVLTRNG